MPPSTTPSPALIREQLGRIIASSGFAKAPKQAELLRFVVEETLNGHHLALTEARIGRQLVRKDYDPLIHPTLRQLAHDLRERLATYYADAYASHPIVIALPKGGYVPTFSLNTPPAMSLIGRTAELNQLSIAASALVTGQGGIVLVAGDAGSGKTTLVDHFLRVPRGNSLLTLDLQGRCGHRLLDGYPLAPILDMLANVVRVVGHDDVKNLLRTSAPRWWGLVASAGGEAPPPPEAATSSIDQLGRELVGFFDKLSHEHSVILFLDDLHWADASTCDMIGYLADRVSDRRLLLIASYRPGEAGAVGRPFLKLKVTLTRNRRLEEIRLGLFNLAQVAEYIETHFSPHRLPRQFPETVHARTDGLPLFVTDLCRFLKTTGAVAYRDGAWVGERDLTTIDDIPDNSLDMIRLTLSQLGDTDRHILECGAVQGRDFDAAVVAHVLELEPLLVDTRLRDLAMVDRLVHERGTHTFGDGTVSLRYQFAHGMYHDVVRRDTMPTQRELLSLKVARTLFALSRDENAMVTKLAELFAGGREYETASRLYVEAARAATRVSAYQSAVMLAERGRQALAITPESRERDARELDVLMLIGVGHMVNDGFTSTRAERAHRRARELCERLGDATRLSTVLWRLHTYELNSGRLIPARELAEDMRRLNATLANPASTVQSLHALGTTLGFIGEFSEARTLLQRIVTISEPARAHAPSSPFVLDPMVTSLSLLARVCALTGHFAEARTNAASSLARAEHLNHPHSVAYAAFWVATVDHFRHAYDRALVNLRLALRLSRRHQLPQILAWAKFLLGSTFARTGNTKEGISLMRASLKSQDRMGCRIERPFCLTLLADAQLSDGDGEEALALCDEAFERAYATGAMCYLADTHRVHAMARFRLRTRRREVVEELSVALTTAQTSGAYTLELRAATEAFRMGEIVNDTAPRRVLERALERFPGDDDSPCVRDARELMNTGRPARSQPRR